MVPRSTQPLRRLLHYAKPFQPRILAATLCSILRTLFDLAPPFLIGVAINILVRQDASWLVRLGIPTVHIQLLVVSLFIILNDDIHQNTPMRHILTKAKARPIRSPTSQPI